jgi:hypothetical protein
MNAEPRDSLMEALTLLRQTARSERRGAPVSSDIGELFLAELQARRERLTQWIRLLREEAIRTPAGGPRHKCKGPARISPNRAGTPSRGAIQRRLLA